MVSLVARVSKVRYEEIAEKNVVTVGIIWLIKLSSFKF